MLACECRNVHDRRRVVLTGGPGAGKTAVLVDAKIAQAWERHPRRFVVESSPEFLDKAARALDILRAEMPECCRKHVVPAIRDRR